MAKKLEYTGVLKADIQKGYNIIGGELVKGESAMASSAFPVLMSKYVCVRIHACSSYRKQ